MLRSQPIMTPTSSSPAWTRQISCPYGSVVNRSRDARYSSVDPAAVVSDALNTSESGELVGGERDDSSERMSSGSCDELRC